METAIEITHLNYLSPTKLNLSETYFNSVSQVVLSNGLIIDRVEKLANDFIRDYAGKDVIILVVLSGAVQFATDFLRAAQLKNGISGTKTVNFIAKYITLKSYKNGESTGKLDICDDGSLGEMRSKNVLIVEDLIDSGFCLKTFIDHITEQFQPSCVNTCVLLVKQKIRDKENETILPSVKYAGFLIPDEFVVGYGMDFNDHFRNEKHICVLNGETINMLKS
ncbi:hypothetical protein SNEBB_004789 [Seison nebaliae]|nr:hypothetical protein SNEBB_004789 [Seison nebaliae]